MDLLADLLRHSRARGAAVARSIVQPPWSVCYLDAAPVSIHAVVRGSAWLLMDGEPPRRLHAGDIAIVRGPQPHTLADDPATPAHIVVYGPNRYAPAGEPPDRAGDRPRVSAGHTYGRRRHGDSEGDHQGDRDGDTALIRGAYQCADDVSPWLLESLPPVLVLSGATGAQRILELVGTEVDRPEPVQSVVLDRLLDLLFMVSLRTWSERQDSDPPRWRRAMADPAIGRALQLLHQHPSRPWTVGTLADTVGLSRSGFARRFHTLVGRPPISYLSQLRITLAAELLTEPGQTLDSIARTVGYADAFSLSSTFKRVRGVSPNEYRDELGGVGGLS
ncbi:AraC family transcriptional regulator [Streptomyces sp. 205]|uniref:AraC family transcriptional regulator n=1 Tax=Streptomyces coffeae TaxID=621382 RepID=A0ABS1NCQ8_9ACTN|nr:AraC family transcriptional regulator [Streptomyces coffeae]